MTDDGDVRLRKADGNLRPLRDIEADVIRHAMRLYPGQLTEVARRLRIGRSTLYRKLDTYQIDKNVAPEGPVANGS